MAISLNHTIVPATDKRASADFLSRILGLLEPTPWGQFLVLPIENGVSLDFVDAHDFEEHHYAFGGDHAAVRRDARGLIRDLESHTG